MTHRDPTSSGSLLQLIAAPELTTQPTEFRHMRGPTTCILKEEVTTEKAAFVVPNNGSADTVSSIVLEWESPIKPLYDVSTLYADDAVFDIIRKGIKSLKLVIGDTAILHYDGAILALLSEMTLGSSRSRFEKDGCLCFTIPFRMPIAIVAYQTTWLAIETDLNQAALATTALLQHNGLVEEMVSNVLICILGRHLTKVILKLLERDLSAPPSSPLMRVSVFGEFLTGEMRDKLMTTGSDYQLQMRHWGVQPRITFPVPAEKLEHTFLLPINGFVGQLIYQLGDVNGGGIIIPVDQDTITQSKLNIENVLRFDYCSNDSLLNDKVGHGLHPAPCHTMTFCTPLELREAGPSAALILMDFNRCSEVRLTIKLRKALDKDHILSLWAVDVRALCFTGFITAHAGYSTMKKMLSTGAEELWLLNHKEETKLQDAGYFEANSGGNEVIIMPDADSANAVINVPDGDPVDLMGSIDQFMN